MSIVRNGKEYTLQTLPYIDAYLSKATVVLADGADDIPLDTVSASNDMQLNSDGTVTLPADGVVAVSAGAMLSPRNGYDGIVIQKNGSSSIDFYMPAGNQSYGCIALPLKLVKVSKGDILKMRCGTSNTADTVQNTGRTHMYISYIETT